MKNLRYTSLCWLAAAAVGCAGKLQNEEAFFQDHLGAAVDAGTKSSAVPDSGAAPRAGAPASDAGAGNQWQDSAAANEIPLLSAVPDAGSKDYDDAGPGAVEPGPVADGGGVAKPAADGGSAMPVAACDFRGLVQMKCGNASCHGAPAMGTGLDLTSASLAMRVAGRKGSGSCSDKLIVDKDNPEQSELYLKVTGTACGVKMPLGGSLTEDEQACVLSWIDGL